MSGDPLTLLADLVREVSELRARVDELEAARGAASQRWLTVDQAGEYLGTTSKAVRRRIDRGRLMAVRDGGRVYVDRLALDAALGGGTS